jgi:hypothetical protein
MAIHAMLFKATCLRLMGERINNFRSAGTSIEEGTMYAALDISNAEVGTLSSK